MHDLTNALSMLATVFGLAAMNLFLLLLLFKDCREPPKVVEKVRQVEQAEDCERCRDRMEEEREMQAEFKCQALSGIQCPECGREVTIFVLDEE